MPVFGGTGSPAVYYQNTAPLNPSLGDFWFDTSGATVLNFRTSSGWVAVSIPTAALDTLSNSVSVLSNAVSVLSQNVSVISQSLSVLSNQISVISQQVSILSNAVSVLSQSVSVLSNSVSVLSQAVSVHSQQISVLSQQMSVVSQQISVLSQQVSIISVQVQSAISIHNALSARADTLSNLVSIGIGINAGVGTFRAITGVQGVSSTAAAGVAISGLSATLSAGGVFHLEGVIIYQMSAADAFGVSFTLPALAPSSFKIYGANATGVSAPLAATFNEDASNSIVYSAIVATATSTIAVFFEGVAVCSTAGTVQLNARVSATTKPANIQRGTYLRSRQLA